MIGRRLLPILGCSRPGLAVAQARLVATPARHTARVRYQSSAAVRERVGIETTAQSDDLWPLRRDVQKDAKGSTPRDNGQKSKTTRSKPPSIQYVKEVDPRLVDVKASKTTRSKLLSKKPAKDAKLFRDLALEVDLDELVLPTKKEVPNLPKGFDEYPGNVFKTHFSNLQRCEYNVAFFPIEEKFAAKVTANIDKHGSYTGTSLEHTKAKAERVATLRLIAKLHEAGHMERLWPDIKSSIPAGTDDAIIDVYNYCANHLSIPQVTHEPWKPEFPTRRKRDRDQYDKCTISLPEQGIQVSAIGTGPKYAEVYAALEFKTAAEAYMAKAGTEQFVVRSQTRLGVDNAQQFHLFLKSIDRSSFHSVETTIDTRTFAKASRELHVSQFYRSTSNTGKIPFGPAATATKKKLVEDLAYVHGAIALCKEDPSLLERFAAALREGDIQSKPAPIDLNIPDEAVNFMARTFGEASKRGLTGAEVELESISDNPDRRRSAYARPLPSDEEKRRISQSLLEQYQRYLTSDTMAAMRKIKADLPMNQYKKEVYSLVQDNIYSIIIGATGSGKTTQVPQIILEQNYRCGSGADCEIICTQPRRIAATSVATRVADEMGPELGKSQVGHQVRFDSKPPSQPAGSVTYCTTGILLQQLQHDPDALLGRVSHLIIDEVHERDKIIDFTLSILKKTVSERLARGLKVPHITLMSATLDTELFANYFKNKGPDGTETEAPVLSVPGRTFPVAEQFMDDILGEMRKSYSASDLRVIDGDKFSTDYLERERKFARANGDMQQEDELTSVIDWKRKATVAGEETEDQVMPYGLVAATIAHVTKTTAEGAILVFFPGLDEMQKVEKLMMAGPVLGVDLQDQSKFRSYMLHSSIQDAQRTVFSPVPKGIRKIILSTNIAETSVTIPDVRHVIDTGKVRETQYDPVKRITALQSTWISRSNAKQRAGRAGRVQNGYYLALYSKARHQSLRVIGLPELLRSDLQTTCLNIKLSIRGVDIRQFLAAAIEPPAAVGVDQAVDDLVALGALTAEERLTELGKLLGTLPIHPSFGKMILLGVLFKCLDPILVVGAAAEERSMFIMAPAVKAQSLVIKKQFADGFQSDHLAHYHAFDAVRNRFLRSGDQFATSFAFSNNIHIGAWKAIYNSGKQMEEILGEAGLIPKRNRNEMIAEGSEVKNDLFGGADLNENSHKPHVVMAIMLAGMMPNVALALPGRRLWRTGSYAHVMRPSASVLFETDKSSNCPRLAAFSSLMKATDGKSIYLRDASVIASHIAVVLFAKSTSVSGRMLEVNGWLGFFVKSTSFQSASRLASFRQVVQWVQNSAFADLAKGKPLHDDPSRALFAGRIVDLIDRSARNDWPMNYTDGLFTKEFLERQAARGGAPSRYASGEAAPETGKGRPLSFSYGDNRSRTAYRSRWEYVGQSYNYGPWKAPRYAEEGRERPANVSHGDDSRSPTAYRSRSEDVGQPGNRRAWMGAEAGWERPTNVFYGDDSRSPTAYRSRSEDVSQSGNRRAWKGPEDVGEKMWSQAHQLPRTGGINHNRGGTSGAPARYTQRFSSDPRDDGRSQSADGPRTRSSPASGSARFGDPKFKSHLRTANWDDI